MSLTLDLDFVCFAFSWILGTTITTIVARTEMIAMTTRISMNENPASRRFAERRAGALPAGQDFMRRASEGRAARGQVSIGSTMLSTRVPNRNPGRDSGATTG